MTIKCVTFDWGDTLAQNHKNAYLVCLRRALAVLHEGLAAAHKPMNAERGEVLFTEIETLWSSSGDMQKFPDNKEVDALKPLLTLFDELAVLHENRMRLLSRFFAAYTNALQPYAVVEPTFQALKERGIRIGILSHVPWPGWACTEWYERQGWDQYVDFYSFSSDVGWIKPHEAHYQDALKQAKCRPEEILHIGDHPIRDVVGAREFGFQTCLKEIEGIYDSKDMDNCRPTYRIVHVSEVLNLI